MQEQRLQKQNLMLMRKELLTKFVDDLGIDGLDIDMETRPSEKDIVLSNGVIRALSKIHWTEVGNGSSIFLYDTNAEYLPPLQDVSDCFDFSRVSTVWRR